MRTSVALLAVVALLTGCFGYNSSAKKWAYVGNSVLIVGGAASIALAIDNKPAPTGTGVAVYQEPFNGGLVGGVLLVAAGVFGIIFNITRDTVKTSR
jgi:hypothetical protein